MHVQADILDFLTRHKQPKRLEIVKETVRRMLEKRVRLEQAQVLDEASDVTKAKAVLLSTPFPHVQKRGGLQQVSSWNLGLMTTRGNYHVTSWSWKRPNLLAAVHRLAAERKYKHPYLAIALVRGESDWHVDSNNQGVSSCMALGDFVGGQLEIEGEGIVSVQDHWHTFQAAERHHRVLPFQGDRLAVVIYLPKKAEEAVMRTWRDLHHLGFPVLQWSMESAGQPSEFMTQELPAIPENET
eukprot:6492010-Amphidinium_carterae.1